MENSAEKTVLLTLGRLPVALDIARGFHALGWRVLVAEPWSMHLARMSRAIARCFRVTSPVQNQEQYLAELQHIVSANSVDLVVPVSEESMHVALLGGRLPTGVDIFCMPQPDMLELHDKYRFVRLAEGFGLRVPKTCLGGDPNSVTVSRSHDVVVKPRYSCSGRGLSYHPAGSVVETDAHSVVQQKLSGEHYSSFSIARSGEILATAAYRATVTDGSVAVCFQRIGNLAAIADWSAEFVRQSGHTGFISFDFIADDEGNVTAIECNPRATSGIHFLNPAAIASHILGERPEQAVHRPEENLTESYSCFTAVLTSLLSPRDFWHRLTALRHARDITWLSSDPWPFLLMMINSWRIIALALFARHSFAAATVLDIEWREPPQE